MKYSLIFMLLVLCNALSAQSISNAEYYFDSDPGFGSGNSLAVNTNTGLLAQTYNIPTTGLSNGFHNLCIRVFNQETNWSHYDKRLVFISKTQNNNFNISEAEYFFDVDPGFGNAISLNVPNQSSFSTALNIPQSFEVGIHKLFIRVKSIENTWSHYAHQLFYVGANPNTDLIEFEYYIDSDDTVFPVTVTTPNNQIISNINTDGLSQGVHIFYFRAKNSNGTWSLYDSAEFTVDGFLSIDEETFNSISLFPNPANDIIHITTSKKFKIEKLTLYDTNGKTIITSNHNTSSLNIDQLNSGLYIINIKTDLGSANFKFIKL